MRTNTNPEIEPLHLMQEASFSLLQWNERDVTDVRVIGADGKTFPFKGAGDVWHCHSGLELVLITKGTGLRLVGDSISAFKAVDLVLTGSNLPHCWHTSGKLSGYAIQFDFPADHAFWKIKETVHLHALWNDAQRGIQYTGKPVAETVSLIQTMPGKSGFEQFVLFMMVLANLQQAPAKNKKLLSERNFPPAQDQFSYRGIQKIINLLMKRSHEKLTLDDILKEACMSKATFERQFKKHTGKTMTRFLTEIRLDTVCRQLIETDLSISEIVFTAGFKSLSCFARQFREIHGETPSSFRSRMKPDRSSV